MAKRIQGWGVVLCGLALLWAGSGHQALAAQSDLPEAAAVSVDPLQVEAETPGKMLQSIVDLRQTLSQRIEEKNRQLDASSSDTEKENLKTELTTLDRQLDNTLADFERIATGIDTSLFEEKEKERFNWQDEVMALVEPGIKELKRITRKARLKAGLKEEVQKYQALLPLAEQAVNNLRQSLGDNRDPAIREHLEALLPEWEGVREQLQNRLKVVQMQLDKMASEEKSLVAMSQGAVKNFFKTRGLYLTLAVLACAGVLLLLRLVYRLTARMVPGFDAKYRPFYVRLLDLVFRVLAVVMTLGALVLIFYLVEDWVLLSLTVVFLLGLGWAAKHTLPKMWHQSRLMLNIGAVREGERLILEGVPWRVRRINVFTELENPDLGVTLRLPISSLTDKVSRPCRSEEIWFPCRKDDWVILADGTRGKVVCLSHEMVELVQRGGAKKVYQTEDFLGQSPLNLSVGFRLKGVFGISYDHQKTVTNTILETLETHIRQALDQEGYTPHLRNFRVEFTTAGASSLDMVVIADFDGEMAPLYNRLNRAIQRWCVDACTLNGWEIPFPQLTVHRP